MRISVPLQSLKKRLGLREKCVVLFPCCTDETFVEILCQSLAPRLLDGLIFDMEHYSYSAREIERAIHVCEKYRIASLVRPLDHSESSFKAALATGCTGLFVNDTRSVEELEAYMRFCFFAQDRGFCPGRPVQHCTNLEESAKLMRECDENFLLFVQIERMLDRTHLEGLLRHPAIDCIHIGPGDMTLASTTGPPQSLVSEDTQEYMKLAGALAEKFGKSFCWSGNDAIGYPPGNVYCSRLGILMNSIRDTIENSLEGKQ